MLRLQLFGRGQASYDSQPLAGFPSQQCFHLLCYLLLNRHHPQARERLAAVFWSQHPTATSRTYLRNALWRLRTALQDAGAPSDEYLSIDGDCVSFVDSGQYWLDVQIFETTVTRFQDRSAQTLTAEDAARLEKAVDLYAGDLLEGVYEDWCLYDRERLRLLYLDALHRLVTFHEYHGPYERGLAYGIRILECDPTREKVHRHMMRLYWLLGDRNEALVQYKRCVQILREELGVRPMERTQQLYKQMVRSQFDPEVWLASPDDRILDAAQQDEGLWSLARHALHKLHRLQTLSQETAAELDDIERLIRQVLTNSR
jgi:DNA-binding SARP family transcriptional activator